MKKFCGLFTMIFLFGISAFSQFRNGYDITYNVNGAIPGRDMDFLKAGWLTTNPVTGGQTACSGGVKHLVKVLSDGANESNLFLDNGNPLNVDFVKSPYVTIRIKSTANKDVQLNMLFTGTPLNKTFTIKGDGLWHIIRLDFSDFPPLAGTTCNSFIWTWTDNGATLPFDIYIDYIRLGGKDDFGSGHTNNTGDPDSTIKMGMNPVANQTADMNSGQQSISLTGITNGTDVSLLSLSQTNTKTTLFQGTPTFSAINSDGTATMYYTPKASTIGTANVHLLLTYNRADTVVKYKSVWFGINVISDPKMTVPASVKAQINQPKVIIKMTNAVNSIGGANGLTVKVTSSNSNLVTNLIADNIKGDGTGNISFIPGQDICGTDTINAVLTDSTTGRAALYRIAVDVASLGCNLPCAIPVPNAKDTTICSGKTATLTATGGTSYHWYNSSTGGMILGTGSAYTTSALYSGTTFYVANYNGTCESTRKVVTVNVIGSSTPHINTLQNNHILCNSAPEQLTATPSGGKFSGDGVEIGYFVPAQAKINHINSIYYKIGDSITGCQATDSLHVFVFPCTGLNDDTENGLRIFPNPANGNFTVEIDNIKDEITVLVIDDLGRLMLEDRRKNERNYSNIFNLSGYPSGIYTVKVIMNDKVISSKVILNPL